MKLIPIVVVSFSCSLAQAEQPRDPGWPRELTQDGVTVVMHQPQIDAWKDYGPLQAKAVIAVTLPDQAPRLGVVQLEAQTVTDLQERSVVLYQVKPTAITFTRDGKDVADDPRLHAAVKALLPKSPVVVSLDRMLAAVERDTKRTREVQVNKAAPPIFFSVRPAILLQFLGEPILEPVPGGRGLKTVVNTNWDVLSPAPGAFYLRVEKRWLTAPDLLKGPWTAATSLPAQLKRLPAGDDWREAREALMHAPEPAAAPRVFVSTEPAELILLDGPPRAKPIPGTRLVWIENTASDLFRDLQTKRFHYLVAGRWFEAEALRGPWKPTRTLPADLQRIPEDHPRAHVLASVPGTPSAREAAILASIPRQATVSRAAPLEVEVEVDGEPELEPVAETGVEWVVNTPADVFRVAGRYYLCQDGVWFESATLGPWALCVSVPSVLYAIPVSHPKHYVTYVRLYRVTPTACVYGYTAGYEGMFLVDGVVVWGTGWVWPYYYSHYRPRWRRCYRVWRSRHLAYGIQARYAHRWGVFVSRAPYYGPYGGVAAAAIFAPTRKTWFRAAAVWGPPRLSTPVFAYAPRPNRPLRGRRPTAYASWGKAVVPRGDRWRRQALRAPRLAKPQRDLYVGPRGTIYQRKPDGTWLRRQGRTWQPAPRPARPAPRPARPDPRRRPRPNRLEREYQRRSRGHRQTRRYRPPAQPARPQPRRGSRDGRSGGSRGGRSGGSRGGRR